MKRIGILPNPEKDKQLDVTNILISKILSAGLNIMLPKDIANRINQKKLGVEKEELFKSADVVISVGGDGTFLRAARNVCCLDTPILGINAGNLGFLAEIDKRNLDKVSDALINNNYRIEERMVLEARVLVDGYESETYYAVNEAVISRGRISRIINNIKVELDGKVIDQFPADGVIISTPTGSTAYSLSAGGPIVEPDMNLMVITPISPHILHARSIVVSDKKSVTIIIDDKNQNDSMLTIDGQESHALTNSHKVSIFKSKHTLKVIKLTDRDFFDIVRDKLFDRNGRR